MAKRINMSNLGKEVALLRHNGRIVGFMPSIQSQQDTTGRLKSSSTRRPLWFLLFASLSVSFIGFQILHTRMLLAHNVGNSNAAALGTEQEFINPPLVSSTARTTPRINNKREFLSRALHRRNLSNKVKKSHVENHVPDHPVKDSDNDETSAATTSTCAPITIPVNDQIWGRQTHELLFQRDQIPGLNLQEHQGRPIKNKKDAEKIDRRFILKALTAFDGRLHIGYGDENLNTGPIPMHAYDPIKHKWIYLGTIPTEEIRTFRLGSNGQALYTPELDGHGDDRRTSVGVHHLTCGANASWSLFGNPIDQSAHNYELAVVPPSKQSGSNNDRLLVGTGARDDQPAFVMASDDAGETWSEFFRLNRSDVELPPNYTENVILRVHTIGVIENGKKIFVSARDKKTHLFFAYVYDETNNTNGNLSTTTAGAQSSLFQPITNLNITVRDDSNRPPYLIPVILNNQMVLVARTYAPPRGEYLGSFRLVGTELVPCDSVWPTVPDKIPKDNTERQLLLPGTSSLPPTTSVTYWTPDVDQNRLLVLLQNEKTGVAGVFRTSSLQPQSPKWEQALLLARLPDKYDRYVSMALLRNDLYLGTWRGHLYVVREFYQPL